MHNKVAVFCTELSRIERVMCSFVVRFVYVSVVVKLSKLTKLVFAEALDYSIRMASTLRACSKSPDQKNQECEVNELQAGVEPSLAVFPQAPVLLQPGKAALDDPALGHDLESVQLAALGDLYRDVFSQDLSHAQSKGLAHVAAVA